MFTAKLQQIFTHVQMSRHAPETKEIDLRSEARAYRTGIDPLRQSGRLGAVLMQFPHAFHNRPDTRRHLSRIVELLPGLPLVAEFRHRSWDDEEALSLLKYLGVGFCNIDQPALGSTLPPTEHVTSRVAYIRLHGRNAGNWFARVDGGQEGAFDRGGGSARYDYFYPRQELTPWLARAKTIAAGAEEVFIIANNHYRGKGPANALMLKSALSGRRVQAPASLITAYPELEDVAEPMKAATRDAPRQGRLF